MNNTLIHIKAVSPYFEVYEIIPENKAVMRLRKIRDNFLWYNTHYEFSSRFPNAKLTVKTCVYNPTLFN